MPTIHEANARDLNEILANLEGIRERVAAMVPVHEETLHRINEMMDDVRKIARDIGADRLM